MLRVLPSLVYLLLYLLSASTHAADSAARPNVLLLLVDDLGYNDSGVYRDVFVQTPVSNMPALESLAKQGVRYTRFYTESTCSASRAALLTGQYPARHGFMPVARGLSSELITLPEYFKTQGYVTHHTGKWHVGEINREAYPLNQGFDSSFGFLSQWMLKGPDAKGRVQLKSPTYINPWLVNGNQPPQQVQGHLEDILTEHTVKLIRHKNSKKKPWFIYHAFFAPHTPLEPAKRFSRNFGVSPESKYKAMLAQLDDSLLQIFSALKETGQWENTIVIVASDNGSTEKHGSSNAPFTGGKANYEEGGIRTPLLVKWHNQSSAETRNDVISIMDIYPSLVAALATDQTKPVDLTGFDGVPSLLPENSNQRLETSLYFLTYGGLSVLDINNNQRLLKRWDAGLFTDTELLGYDKKTLPQSEQESFIGLIFNKKDEQQKALFENFISWRDGLRQVPLHFDKKHDSGAGVLTGMDFLRTPINPAYAMAFSFTAAETGKKQNLIYQKGITDIYLQNGALVANVHGMELKQENIVAGQCYSIVLSGEFYDQYSNVREAIQPSRIHLVVDGKLVQSASAEISSFQKLDIATPTLVGMRSNRDKKSFAGTISQPKVYVTQLLPDDRPIPSGLEQEIAKDCAQ